MPYNDKSLQTAYQREYVAKRRQEWIAANGPCRRCGGTKDLQVDHVERGTKITHRVWSWAKPKRDAELAKCQVLCKECHRQKSALEMSKPIEHGSSAGYSRGCRCSLCREGQRVYMERYRRGEFGGVLPKITRV